MLSETQINSLRSSKNVVFAAFVVIGTFALYNRIFIPHENYLQTAQAYLSATNKIVKKSGFIQTNVKLKKKKLKELQDKFGFIHIKLFDPTEAEEFFSDIQAMAEETNCIIYSLNFTPTNTVSEDDQAETSCNINENCAAMNIAGNYKDILAMINKLQDRPKQVWVDSVSIEPVSNNPNLLKCDMTIRIYVISGVKGHSYD